MTVDLQRLDLTFNPFEPAASGAPLIPSAEELWLPASWKKKLVDTLDPLGSGTGVKVLALAGEYGSGKTYILQWLYQTYFPNLRVRPFYFDNPGVQFYALANSWLRRLGRKDFAKSIWELAAAYTDEPAQRSLFTQGNGYEDFLRRQPKGAAMENILRNLQEAIEKSGIATEGEIAYLLARLVAETPRKPYFEYSDFIAGRANALVPEGEEAPYFASILRTLRLAGNANAVAFLVDEFEEVSQQKYLSRKEAYEYLTTLKRLINLGLSENLWVVLSLTRDAVQITKDQDPALWERLTNQGDQLFDVPSLSIEEAKDLVRYRIKLSRSVTKTVSEDDLFPFSSEALEQLTPATFSVPRRLIKICFFAIAESGGQKLPFSSEYLRGIELRTYPENQGGRPY